MRFVLMALVLVACGAPAENPSEPAPEVAPAEAKPAAQKGGEGAKKGKAPAQERVEVQVQFVDDAKFAAGDKDFLVPVTRRVAADNPPRNALWHLFRGPGPKEKERGLSVVKSGATGFENLRVEDGVAHVTLKGGCDAAGSTLTVYDLIVPTLKQFDEIQHVKVYGPDGQTADASAPGDSRPACLEP